MTSYLADKRADKTVIFEMKKQQKDMKNWFSTARTLSEALPFLQRYDGAKIVIKLGGHAMSDAAAMQQFARDIVLMKQTNIHPIIVHGGGPMINAMLERLSVKSEFLEGKRITTPEIMEVVEMVLSGKINSEVACAINREGGRAIGLSGKDADLILCDFADERLGLVGEPKAVNGDMLNDLIEAGYIPVIAPIGTDEEGRTFNINGDTVAGSVASATRSDRLLLLTDVDGVRDLDGDVITELHPDDVERLIAEEVIAGGMIPKTQTACKAVEGGVRAVVILDGRQPHAVLLELFTKAGAGTLVRGDQAPIVSSSE